MKITLSKSQWEGIGKKAGWMKEAEMDLEGVLINTKLEPFIVEINGEEYRIIDGKDVFNLASKFGIGEIYKNVPPFTTEGIKQSIDNWASGEWADEPPNVAIKNIQEMQPHIPEDKGLDAWTETNLLGAEAKDKKKKKIAKINI